VSGELLLVGNIFFSLEKVLVFPRYDHFCHIWRYKFEIRPFQFSTLSILHMFFSFCFL
jgi:hypothetical protein